MPPRLRQARRQVVRFPEKAVRLPFAAPVPAPRSPSAPRPARSAGRGAAERQTHPSGQQEERVRAAPRVTSPMPAIVTQRRHARFLARKPTVDADQRGGGDAQAQRQAGGGDHGDAAASGGGHHRAIAQQRHGQGDEGERRGEFQAPVGRHAGADEDARADRQLPGRPIPAEPRRSSSRACRAVRMLGEARDAQAVDVVGDAGRRRRAASAAARARNAGAARRCTS